MSRLFHLLKIAPVATFVFAIGACGAETPPPPPTPPAARAKPAPKAEKKETEAESPTTAPEPEYSYSPVGKRDPFRSYVQVTAPVPVLTVDPNCGELCTWELSQLRLVAVVWGMANPEAMVEDPKGHGHMIRRGMSIGKRSGKVTEVRPDRLVVTEIFHGPGGQVHPAETEILLRGKGAAKEAQIVDLIPQDEQE